MKNQHVTGCFPTENTLRKITQAGCWYAENGHRLKQPIIPQIRDRFGLSMREAIAALKLAGEIRAAKFRREPA